MMLDSITTHQVLIMPPRDPTPTDIHLDDDPKNLVHDTSNTTASPALEMTEPAPLPMQTRTEIADTVPETISQIPIAVVAEAETASIEVQSDIDTNRTSADAEAGPEIVEEVVPVSLSQAEDSNSNYTTSTLAEIATPGADVTAHEVAHEDASISAAKDTPHAEEIMPIEAHKPENIEREVSGAISTKSMTEDTEAPELELTTVINSEQKGSDTVEFSIGKQRYSCTECPKPSKLVAERTQKQDGLDQVKIAFEVVSPDEDSSPATDSNSEAGNSDDTSAQVGRIAAAYGPSEEGQTKPEGSLFGGPAGPQIPQPTDTPEISEIGTITQTEIPKGFEDLFTEEEVTTENNILPEDSGLDMNSFDFTNSNFEQDVEPEAEVGAEQEISSQPPSSDHDAKPDMKGSDDSMSPNYTHNPTSPAYSHTTSNNSYATQRSSDPSVNSTLDLIHSGGLYAADSKETPEEFSRHEQDVGSTSHPMSEAIEEQPPCNCEGQHCEHRVRDAFGLRPGPRKEGSVYFSNLVYDNDQSGTYTDEQRYYPSTQKVAMEDLDDDEETNDDQEEDHVMSGGLLTNPADPNGRFSTIPFNHTDALIRDKRPFEEESSSDESRTKKNKKRKKAKTKSSKASKKSKNNNGTSKTRTPEDAEDHIEIDEQASTPAPKAPFKKTTAKKASTKKPPSTTAPANQTIVQMLQRLAKPHTTRLSYPIIFNSPASSCSICKDPSYAINGCSPTPRKIKIYDFGQGSQEIPDADDKGNAVDMGTTPEQTQLCLSCTTGYMKVLMCSTHDISPITASPSQPASTSSPSTQSPSSQSHCTICATPATYTCDRSCGANFCDTCTYKVHGEHDGNLSAMLEGMTDEVSGNYPRGLRADVELLRKGGELWGFLRRMARKKVAA